jgi:ferredoxin-NADP reductase
LCGDPGELNSYRIAVLRVSNGRGGSEEIHTSALVGRELSIRGPRNHFKLRPAEQYLFIAGGIGITPILPMVREVARQASAPWSLVYGGRSLNSMAFLRELEELPRERVVVVPEDRDGRRDLFQLFASLEPGAAAYCCGPSGLLDAAQEVAVAFPAVELNVERFATSDQGAPTGPSLDASQSFEVVLARMGVTIEVPAGVSILSALRDVVPDVMWSCGEGYCGTCETGVLEGEPDHRDSVLQEEERALGQSMMICVSRARTSRLVLDL